MRWLPLLVLAVLSVALAGCLGETPGPPTPVTGAPAGTAVPTTGASPATPPAGLVMMATTEPADEPLATPIPATPVGVATPFVDGPWGITIAQVRVLAEIPEPATGDRGPIRLQPQGTWVEVWADVSNKSTQNQNFGHGDWILRDPGGRIFPMYEPTQDNMAYTAYIGTQGRNPVGIIFSGGTHSLLLGDFDVANAALGKVLVLEIAPSARITLGRLR
ncbi:MAG TPA: hypothetical protein VKY74_16860 [Chloroflexia bacterium]|nr:hypothetical protein [Chloroflexia bacterium]